MLLPGKNGLKPGGESLVGVKSRESECTMTILTETQELLFWKEDIFSGFIPFFCYDSEPFLSFFTFNQLNYQYGRESDTCSYQNFFGFHVINTLKYLSKIDV